MYVMCDATNAERCVRELPPEATARRRAVVVPSSRARRGHCPPSCRVASRASRPRPEELHGGRRKSSAPVRSLSLRPACQPRPDQLYARSGERETRQCTALAPIAHRNCPAVPRQRSAFVGEATQPPRNPPRSTRDFTAQPPRSFRFSSLQSFPPMVVLSDIDPPPNIFKSKTRGATRERRANAPRWRR